MSPLLFLLAIEILAIAIHESPQVQGITVGTEVFKLMLYADDTNLFLANQESLKHVKDILEWFAWVSGMVTNPTKTKVTGLGPLAQAKGTVYGFTVDSQPIKILGIWYVADRKRLHDMNVNGKLAKMKHILNMWKFRGLTIQGKILILKSLGISQLTYSMMNLFVHKGVLAQIDKLIFNFIWGGARKAKVARAVMIQD